MALRKALAKRSFEAVRVTTSLTPLSVVVPDHQTIVPPNAAQVNFHREYLTSSEPSEKGFFRRFLHHSATRIPELFSLPVGEKLREKINGLNVNMHRKEDRLRLEGLSPPPAAGDESFYGVSVNDVRKIMRLSQVQKLKARLREVPESSVSYSEFRRICVEGCESVEQAAEFAKLLDDSGNVIVLGNVVFLQPEQVAKSIESIISQTMSLPNDPRRRELEQLEKQKVIIDQKARALVRGELYGGLGFMLLQTLGAIRLTFWELSWDVMEPICFFVTSIHFALGYGFFLRTYTEPTFQGFFQRRFKTKQQKLMEVYNFDVQKYNQLRKVFYPNSGKPVSTFDHVETTLVGDVH
ncbi:PREDICTED: calcium uniporter protein 4, mitochondrial [Fragaria vesca subsp. vesca]|uniref:calcium uniporter protein 4, mitochondrial n=1 Tax=Fragaria vesca subsp. vesca TaxID=101020 RepID=UPI0002C334F5|nr:PREDICTED: calcium uniporter protein 4, mitochondrial [Fragaria vesca subsp. vesca]